MGYALSDLAAKQGSPPLNLQFCEYLNISVCPASQNDSVRWRGWDGEEICHTSVVGGGRGMPHLHGGEGEEVCHTSMVGRGKRYATPP